MPIPTEIVLFALFITIVIWMGVRATLLVMRDTLSEPPQRLMQLALVWSLPVLGPIIVFAVHLPGEKHPGKYREAPDPGEDFGFPRHAGRRAGADGDDD